MTTRPYEDALTLDHDDQSRWHRAAGIAIDGLPPGVDPAEIEFEVRVRFAVDGETIGGAVDCYRASWTHDGVFVIAECPDLERLSRLILRAFHFPRGAVGA